MMVRTIECWESRQAYIQAQGERADEDDCKQKQVEAETDEVVSFAFWQSRYWLTCP